MVLNMSGDIRQMKEECLICKALLEYLNEDVEWSASFVIRRKTVRPDASTVTMSVIEPAEAKRRLITIISVRQF